MCNVCLFPAIEKFGVQMYGKILRTTTFIKKIRKKNTFFKIYMAKCKKKYKKTQMTHLL